MDATSVRRPTAGSDTCTSAWTVGSTTSRVIPARMRRVPPASASAEGTQSLPPRRLHTRGCRREGIRSLSRLRTTISQRPACERAARSRSEAAAGGDAREVTLASRHMRRLLPMIVAACLATTYAGTTAAAAATVNLAATADTYVRSDRPTSKYGTRAHLYVKGGGG